MRFVEERWRCLSGSYHNISGDGAMTSRPQNLEIATRNEGKTDFDAQVTFFNITSNVNRTATDRLREPGHEDRASCRLVSSRSARPLHFNLRCDWKIRYETEFTTEELIGSY
jgi:hypothetical protein